MRSVRDSVTSMAVTSPPAPPTAVASSPTTDGDGTAWIRTVIEYDALVGSGRGRAESGRLTGPFWPAGAADGGRLSPSDLGTI